MNSAKRKIFPKDIFHEQRKLALKPYIPLRGLRNGYKWTPSVSGHWTSFMNVEKKRYTVKNTGTCVFLRVIFS